MQSDVTQDLAESVNPWVMLEPNSEAELAWCAAQTKAAGRSGMVALASDRPTEPAKEAA